MLGTKVKLILLCSLIVLTNTKTSTKWQLNSITKKIEYAKPINNNNNNNHKYDDFDIYKQDKAFFIIVASEELRSTGKNDTWLRKSAQMSLETLQHTQRTVNTSLYQNNRNESIHNRHYNYDEDDFEQETLDCGQPINYTQYDYIINIDIQSKRNNTKLLPEPEVAYFFLRNQDKMAYKNFNINSLEKRLRKAKHDNPISAKVYHHLGNYWRIKGDATEAVKCFRRSLDISPTESEVMFNLGKVLFNLQYLDDAIHIIRRSIEFQSHSHVIWRQYFLLGEILRVYGDNRGSMHYYRLALQLNPTHELLAKTIKNFNATETNTTIHTYTVFIILTLIIAVLITIVLSSSMNDDHQQKQLRYSAITNNLKGCQRPNVRPLKCYAGARHNRLRKF